MGLLQLYLEINKIGKEIEKMKDYDELGSFLYHKLKKLIDFDFLSLGKIDEKEMKLNYYFYVENGIVTSNIEIPIIAENSLSYYSYSNKRIILMNDVEKEYKNYIKALSNYGTSYENYSLLTIPIYDKEKDEIKALLSVQNWRKNAFDVEGVVLFKEIASYLDSVLSKFESKKEAILHSQSLEDSRSLLGSFIIKSSKAENIKALNKIFYEFCNSFFGVKSFILTIFRELKVEKYLIESNDNSDFCQTLTNKNYLNNKSIYNLNHENKNFASLQFDKEITNKKETLNIIINIYKLSFIKLLEKEELTKEIKENEKMLDILKTSYDNIRILNELGQNIVASDNLKDVCFLIYGGLKKILLADLSIIIVKKDENQLNYTAVENNTELPMNSIDMEKEPSLSSYVIKNSKTIVINDYDEDIFLYYSDSSQAIRNVIGTPSNSIIYIPLIEGKRIIGAFSVQSNTKNFFDNYKLEIIKNIASFVSIALSHENRKELLTKEIALVKKDHLFLKRENLELEKISSTDSLSGLINRREFERQFKELIKDKNAKINIFMVLIDLDYFKHINDTFGHLEGDKYLIEISKVFKEFQNDNIVFSRYGGDEFAAYFYDKSIDEVKIILENILENLKRLYLPNPFTKANQTLTIGVANMLDLKENSYRELYRRSDNALYLGKNKGRNQIVFI